MSIPVLAKRPLQKDLVLSKVVTGHSLDTLGTTDVTLKLGSQTLHHNMQVIRNVDQGTLLGMDFLKPHKVVLDMGGGICSLYGQNLPLLKRPQLAPESCTARIMECTTVPPCCEMNCSWDYFWNPKQLQLLS